MRNMDGPLGAESDPEISDTEPAHAVHLAEYDAVSMSGQHPRESENA